MCPCGVLRCVRTSGWHGAVAASALLCTGLASRLALSAATRRRIGLAVGDDTQWISAAHSLIMLHDNCTHSTDFASVRPPATLQQQQPTAPSQQPLPLLCAQSPSPTPISAMASGSVAPSFFVDHKRGEVNELKMLLNNPKLLRELDKKREVIKKVRRSRADRIDDDQWPRRHSRVWTGCIALDCGVVHAVCTADVLTPRARSVPCPLLPLLSSCLSGDRLHDSRH